MNAMLTRNDRNEMTGGGNPDRSMQTTPTDKWVGAIQDLIKIIEKSERRLGYFQNRLRQAEFIDRPKQRMVRAAADQRDEYADQLSDLRIQLQELEQLHGGSVTLRATTETDLRHIWRWMNEPEMRGLWREQPPTFPTFVSRWHRWLADGEMHPVSIERVTGELVGFLLIGRTAGRGEPHYATLEFIIIGEDYRHRGYGTTAVRQAVRFAFEQLDVDGFTTQVDLENEFALQCFEKSGLGYLNIDPTSDDPGLNLYVMGIYRNEWTREGKNEDVSAAEVQLTAKLLASLKELIAEA
jgi:RimJ/RimL family protein N-acetyltransferase